MPRSMAMRRANEEFRKINFERMLSKLNQCSRMAVAGWGREAAGGVCSAESQGDTMGPISDTELAGGGIERQRLHTA